LVRIGTRSTTMALAQTEAAAALLSAATPSLDVKIVRYKPRGDQDQVSKLDRHGGKGGAFVEEIRSALRENNLDVAMHSLKDMPGDETAPGLCIGAYIKREARDDALVLKPGLTLKDFSAAKGAGFKIGTNAVRRAAYLKMLYPDAEIIHYRGAADTRIKKLDDNALQTLPNGDTVGPADALVMAACGLSRVGQEKRIMYRFPTDEILPAVGQGVVALECRADNWRVREILAAIDDPITRIEAEAEREMLWILNGHCNSPIAGAAKIIDGDLHLKGAVISEDGDKMVMAEARAPIARPRELGRTVGMALLRQGAEDIIKVSEV